MKRIILLALIITANIGYSQSFNPYNYDTQNSDILWDVIEYDSGYLLTGFSQDSGISASYDSKILAEPVLIKLSKTGNPIDTLIPAAFGNTEIELLSAYNNGFFYTFGITNPPNDSFRLVVTKYDTLFNLIQRKEYAQLQGENFRQLHKTKEVTDSSLYLVGYYDNVNSYFHQSFILNYNFNTMEFDYVKRLPSSCIINDVLVDDTSYFCALFWYDNIPGHNYAIRYDTAFNIISKDTLFVSGNTLNNIMFAYFTLKRYKDSLYLCSGFGIIENPYNNYQYDYQSIVVQTYNPEFEIIGQKYWYYDSIVNLETSYNNSFVANKNNEYFVCATANIDMFYPNQGIMIAKVDSNLNTIWQKHIECNTATMRAMNILPTDDGGVLVLYWEQASLTGKELHNSKLIKIGPNGEVTGITDLKLPNRKAIVSIFPNPTSQNLNISLLAKNQNIEEIRIYDLQFKEILNRKVNSTQTTIDVSKFAKGVYIVEGKTNTGEDFMEKFMVE